VRRGNSLEGLTCHVVACDSQRNTTVTSKYICTTLTTKHGEAYQQRVEIKAGLEYQFKEGNVHWYASADNQLTVS
jgi:hypothetical protein